MAPKLGLLLILIVLCLPYSFAVEPIQPIAQTEEIIVYQHEQTRQWCQDQWNAKEEEIKKSLEAEKNDLETRTREVLWLDRIISFISIFLACFMAFSLRSYLDHKHKRKIEAIDKIERNYEQLPALTNPPTPGEDE